MSLSEILQDWRKWEARLLDFVAESFNILNHTNVEFKVYNEF